MRNDNEGLGILLGLCLVLAGIAAYVTHIVWTFKLLLNDQTQAVGKYVLAALGTFMPPLGVIHGFAMWFGWA